MKQKLNQHSKNLEALEERLQDLTTKEEFYDFIRELNDELRKIEKNIVTHDSLERIQTNLNIKFRDFENQKKLTLKELKALDKKIRDIDEKLNKTYESAEKYKSIKRELEETKKNFVNWQQFFEKVKEISEENNLRVVEGYREEFEEGITKIDEELSELKDNSVSLKVFEKNNKKLLKLLKKEREEGRKLLKTIKEQGKAIKEQERAIRKLEEVIKHEKVTKGRKKKETNLFWPITVLTIITLGLIIGMFFLGPSLMNPKTYESPQDIECQNKFECRNIKDSMFLVNCTYDDSLENCHCILAKNPDECRK